MPSIPSSLLPSSLSFVAIKQRCGRGTGDDGGDGSDGHGGAAGRLLVRWMDTTVLEQAYRYCETACIAAAAARRWTGATMVDGEAGDSGGEDDTTESHGQRGNNCTAKQERKSDREAKEARNVFAARSSRGRSCFFALLHLATRHRRYDRSGNQEKIQAQEKNFTRKSPLLGVCRVVFPCFYFFSRPGTMYLFDVSLSLTS